ncbi:MAG: hypothetical protein LBQ12_00040, partial [Deltaproteobacteria bacterium]|nr:hypothetical protein [Deltaproteobacteria bacterium]
EGPIKKLKISKKGNPAIISIKKTDLAKQEIWGLPVINLTVRALMNQTSFQSNIDIERLSLINSVRIIKKIIVANCGFSSPCPRHG